MLYSQRRHLSYCDKTMVRSAANIKTEAMDEVDFENWQLKTDKAVDLNLEKDVNDDTYKVELQLDLEETRINIEKYDGNDVVPQFEENIKTEIPDFEMVLVKEEPQTFITSEQNNDSSDAIQTGLHSPPEIVIPKLKCDPHSSCEEAENSTSQNYVPGSHQAEVVSAKETRYKCEFCDKTYARRAYLNRHLKYHTGLNLYECYEGRKKYTCDICGQHYSSNDYLKEHRKLHFGIKALQCQCGEHFIAKKKFRDHLRVYPDHKLVKGSL